MRKVPVYIPHSISNYFHIIKRFMSKKREMCSGYCSGLTLNYAGRREKMKELSKKQQEWLYALKGGERETSLPVLKLIKINDGMSQFELY